MDLQIPQITKTLQEEVTVTDNKVENVVVTDDLLTYASVSFTFGGKPFNGILWDENSTPTYEEIGVWTNEDAITQIVNIINEA